MKFLVDNQLPPALARFLSQNGHDAVHVLDIGLDETPDVGIWHRAITEGRTLVSKDEDFLTLASQANQQGSFVWVRVPNCRKSALLSVFERVLPAMVAALVAGNRIVEVR